MSLTSINYIRGDATEPNYPGNKIIVHVCNNVGAWGAGFVLSISKKWKEPEIQYYNWYNSQSDFRLGAVQFVAVEKSIWVANLIGQHNLVPDENKNPPIRYNAISEGLESISEFAIKKNATVHMPRIGCGLAGGTWEEIEPLLQKHLLNKNIKVFVYDL